MSTAAQQRLRGTMLALAALIVLVALGPPSVLGNVIQDDSKLQPPSSQSEESAASIATRFRLQTNLLNYSTYVNNQNMTECRLPSPCGWFMYHPVERYFLHFLQVCSCPTGLRCLADRDDVTISCWVYMCKVPPPGTPNVPPGQIPPV